MNPVPDTGIPPAPGLPEALGGESRRRGGHLGLCIGALLGFGGRDIPDRLAEAAVVEPIHPFQGGKLHGHQPAPGDALPDDLGLERSDEWATQRARYMTLEAIGAVSNTAPVSLSAVPA